MVEQKPVETLRVFESWICYGRTKNGFECRRVLLESLPTGQEIHRKVCDKCGTLNVIQYLPQCTRAHDH